MQRPAAFVRLVLSFALVALSALSQPSRAFAQSADALPAQLDALGHWITARQQPVACTERCFVLDRLALTGSLGAEPDGTSRLAFELTGSVLAAGPVAVPLFGTPDHVSIEQATEDGHAASIGFEGDHYYLYTSSRHFTLRGTLALHNELALMIPGPLNALAADLARGSVVEGARLSGLAATTIHFDAGASGGHADVASPAVFQIARAVRVAREVTFEYRITMRSGHELGVVRFPLAFGERVLDVQGAATGWRVEGTDLVLPTAGREAQVTVTGALPSLAAAFAPDTRSAYEWWLFESDPEHRIQVASSGRAHDASESPIARTQPNARLYLVARGQHAQLTVQSLVSADVLAAVVRQHSRTVVVTARGDLVADDTLAYDNNGIDYLIYTPAGRPIYLGTDGTSERIMRREHDPSTVMIPLRDGPHTAHVQSLSSTHLATLAGRLALDAPSYPLAASRATVTLGLPRGVHPLFTTGGDCTHAFVDTGDGVALLFALGAALLALRGRTRRTLGAVALGGLWFASPGAFVALLVLLAGAGVAWVVSRFVRGPQLVASVVVVMGGAALASLAGLALVAARGETHAWTAPVTPSDNRVVLNEGSTRDALSLRDGDIGGRGNAYGSFNAQLAQGGGEVQGVTPVAITLPGYERGVTFTRELVTRDRPFRPVLWYVTDMGLAPLALAWLACLAALIALHRREIRALRERISARLARRDEAGAGAVGVVG